MSASMNPDELRALEREGFIVIRDLVPLPEVDAIRQILQALHDQNVGYKEGAQFDAIGVEACGEPRRFPQILEPRNYAPQLAKTRFHKLATEMARAILGPQARFAFDVSFMKPALIGAATPWHQDEAFRDPEFYRREVSFWLALQPTDQSNSCMSFIPGSHHGPVLRHGHPEGDSRVHALECVDDFDASQAIVCPLPAGGCTIHTGRTLHYAGPNTSDRARLAYALTFDVPPIRITPPRVFPWLRGHVTARDLREQAWRRRGGLFIYLWRQRSRVRFANFPHVLHALGKAVAALQRLPR